MEGPMQKAPSTTRMAYGTGYDIGDLILHIHKINIQSNGPIIHFDMGHFVISGDIIYRFKIHTCTLDENQAK